MTYLVEWYEEYSSHFREEIEADSKEDAINIANNICIEPLDTDITGFEIESIRPVE